MSQPPPEDLTTGVRQAIWLPPRVTQIRRRLEEGVFYFLGKCRRRGWPPVWTADDESLLWRYHLSYLDYGWVLDIRELRELVNGFWEGCLVDGFDPAWDPYPTAARLINLIGWLARYGPELAADEVQRWWYLVWFHSEWLRRNMEYDLLGNHLLEDALALAIAGAAFSGRYGARWSRAGKSILRRELRRQILPDGLHYERSPMYHARLLRHILNLRAIDPSGADRAFLDPIAERMLRAHKILEHPDTQPALVNDCAMHSEHSAESLISFARRLGLSVTAPGEGPWSLPQAGYYGWQGAGAFLVIDAGALGPRENPGHAHGDIFSFELSLAGSRVIVDSGVYDYEPGEMRAYCRSTAAHNTLTVNDTDQAEFWGAFRVAGLPRVTVVRWRGQGQMAYLRARHDGYLRLAQKAVHQRRFRWYPEGVLLVTDEVCARRAVKAVARLHLDPLWVPVSISEQHAVFCSGSGASVSVISDHPLWLEQGWYCPEFGVRKRNYVLCSGSFGRTTRMRLVVAKGEGWELDGSCGAVRGCEIYPF